MKAPLPWSVVACLGLATSCSDPSSTAEPHAVPGGAASVIANGGTDASGGSTGGNASPATGGVSPSSGTGGGAAGGAASTSGGSGETGTGGATATGGASGGSATTTGGMSAVSGGAATGGASATGGKSAGGAATTGGKSAGGSAGAAAGGSSEISQSGWELVSVSSEETVDEDGAAANAFDGSTSTRWHTGYGDGGTPVHPHELVIDLGASYRLTSFRYTPRQDKDENGMIADYEFYVSESSSDFGEPVAEGTFDSSRAATTVPFPAKLGRYIRLVALSEINGQKFASAAELEVQGTRP